MTFCWHTIVTRLRQALSHLFLDTGAFMSHKPYPNYEVYALMLVNVPDFCWIRASYQNSEVILSAKTQCQ